MKAQSFTIKEYIFSCYFLLFCLLEEKLEKKKIVVVSERNILPRKEHLAMYCGVLKSEAPTVCGGGVCVRVCACVCMCVCVF